MALTTRKTALLANPNKATRQQIPPFLSKLYHMVNDPETDNLIRWSETGDSFYVYDHERFAKDVLPSWFKHSNFGSFVRQLNNYGFHKVPHLQQGVLRSDGETEISHFENQYFQRGQPDLLCLIQRKKQLHNEVREDSPSTDFKEPVVAGSSTSQANGAESDSTHSAHNIKGTVIDINGVVNGIQAIKRHQHAISAELKELHQTNQLLWQEVYAARERHKKHHDTITRILKFLAGVFGHTANGSPRTQEVPHASPDKGSSSAVVPRRGNLLMIESNGKPSKPNGTPASELNIHEMMEPLDFEGGQANDGERFATIETAASPASAAPTVASTPKHQDAQSLIGDLPSPETLMSPTTTPATVPPVNGYPFPATNHNRITTPTQPEPVYPPNYASTSAAQTNPPVTILAPASPGPSPADMQNSFASIFNNPTQLQRVLAALGGGVPMPMSMPDNMDPSGMSTAGDTTPTNSVPIPYPGYRASTDAPSSLSLFHPVNGMGALSITPPSDDSATLNSLAQSNSQLAKSYKDAAAVEADVNTLQNHIDSLIESLGVDPNTSAALRGDPNHQHLDEDIVTTTAASATNTIPATQFDLPSDTFDFDSFLSFDPVYNNVQPGLNAMANGADKIGAFLDEVRSVSNDSDVTDNLGGVDGVDGGGDGTGGGGLGRKRKSDAVEFAPEGGKSPKASRTSTKR